jgi:hypothetical protein
VKLFAYPDAPVVLIFKEVNPESKREFGDGLAMTFPGLGVSIGVAGATALAFALTS